MNKNFHFVSGRVVTDKDKTEAPPNSVFRSAAAYTDGEPLYPCSSVSGCAPRAYIDKFGLVSTPKPKMAKPDK